MRDMAELRKDIDTVLEWRRSGHPLTTEQQYFADKVADEMIGLRVSKQTGVQLVSKANINYIKGMQPVQGSDAVGGITQDAVASGSAKTGKFPRKTEEEEENPVVKKVDIKSSKPKEMDISGAKVNGEPRKSPDAANITLNPPENQAEGAITSVADADATEVTQPEADAKTKVPSEQIGHNPNEPMPKKQAEDLVNNAKWGVEIGAYVSIKEGIERQLSRKSYAEFTDTAEKLKAVSAYLISLIPETEPTPVNA